MEMPQQGRVYAILGILLLGAILYFNLYGASRSFHLRLPFPWLQPGMPFVLRNSTHFLLSVPAGTRPLYLNGWNSYWMLAAASSPSSRPRVLDMLRRARRMGMTVCRTWAFSDGGPNALQISPGRLDEDVFQALDYVVYEARRNGVWLILSLVNNLKAFGGKQQYVRWAREAGVNVSASGYDDFFSDPTIKGYYRDYVKAIITRENSYSGIRYSEEPAIFAWELINEPRCTSNSSAPLLQAWIAEMAAYVKSLDTKHLVTVGLEGFYGPRRSKRHTVNPGDWAAMLGSDFIQNSATDNIDFASVHAYPDNWIPKASFEEKARYLADWVDMHLNDSENVLKKPVLFTEVGSYLHTKKKGLYHRDILLKIMYDKIYESAKRGGVGAGALIWQLMVEGMQGESDMFSLVASEHPTTRNLIVKQSCRLKHLPRTNRTVEAFPCNRI